MNTSTTTEPTPVRVACYTTASKARRFLVERLDATRDKWVLAYLYDFATEGEAEAAARRFSEAEARKAVR